MVIGTLSLPLSDSQRLAWPPHVKTGTEHLIIVVMRLAASQHTSIFVQNAASGSTIAFPGEETCLDLTAISSNGSSSSSATRTRHSTTHPSGLSYRTPQSVPLGLHVDTQAGRARRARSVQGRGAYDYCHGARDQCKSSAVSAASAHMTADTLAPDHITATAQGG